MAGVSIDHSAGEPVWKQLAAILRGRIESGEWEQGKLLPSVRTLAQEYGVAEMTVKKALGRLRDDHLVSSAVGRGWYVL